MFLPISRVLLFVYVTLSLYINSLCAEGVINGTVAVGHAARNRPYLVKGLLPMHVLGQPSRTPED